MLEPLAHSVPIALRIFADDQWSNVRRVAEIGPGVVLDGDRSRRRRMLDGPDPQTFAALPGAIERVLADPGYRRAAGGVADAIDALAPVDAAVGALQAIATKGRRERITPVPARRSG